MVVVNLMCVMGFFYWFSLLFFCMVVREDVLHWLEQALHDMDTADYLFKGGIFDAACFYAHQSIEKSLKAYIIYSKREAPINVHSLIRLGKEVDLPKSFHKILKEMGPEYYISRYPDAVEDVPYKTYEEDEVKEKLKKSREVVEWIKSKIGN